MIRAAPSRWLALAALMVAAIAVTLVLQPRSAKRAAPDPSRRARPVVIGGRAAARPRASRPLRRREVVTVARRFAAAYAAWDAGRRDPGVARRLARVMSPALVASLRAGPPRPTARPASPLGLQPAGVYAGPSGERRTLVPAWIK